MVVEVAAALHPPLRGGSLATALAHDGRHLEGRSKQVSAGLCPCLVCCSRWVCTDFPAFRKPALAAVDLVVTSQLVLCAGAAPLCVRRYSGPDGGILVQWSWTPGPPWLQRVVGVSSTDSLKAAWRHEYWNRWGLRGSIGGLRCGPANGGRQWWSESGTDQDRFLLHVDGSADSHTQHKAWVLVFLQAACVGAASRLRLRCSGGGVSATVCADQGCCGA